MGQRWWPSQNGRGHVFTHSAFDGHAVRHGSEDHWMEFVADCPIVKIQLFNRLEQQRRLKADMFNSTAYGKAVVECIHAVK
jgi:hypothetical protein